MLSTRLQQRLETGVSRSSVIRTGMPLQRMVMRATTEAPPATQQQVPPVDFEPTKPAGYVEFDTAGQNNMYPTITKAYEVPAGGDTSSATSATNNTALIAGGLAITLIGLGLGALTASSGSEVTAAQDLSSLTQYAAKFAAEL